MMTESTGSAHRCGIVLAAGDGRRLQPLIRRLRGDALPKQYMTFSGSRSLLEQTIHRAERVIPPERLFTVVGQHHLSFPEVVRQLAVRPPGTVVIQPENKETAPGILLPLVALSRRYPDAVVTVFPSDHFIREEGLFMGHVELACHAIERELSDLILLGIEPQGAETEYGYLVPGQRSMDRATDSLRRIVRFVEKPEVEMARTLAADGALWNSFVMVFRASTLLKVVHTLAPQLFGAFERIRRAVGMAEEQDIIGAEYRAMEPVNFSRSVLEALPRHPQWRLSTLPVRGVTWSDWGSERRLRADLATIGSLSGGDQSYSFPSSAFGSIGITAD